MPQIHHYRWMVGESYGKPSQLWFRDCKKVFNDELEEQFQAGEDVREFQWVGGRYVKVFLRNLVDMTQTNITNDVHEVKLLRRVIVTESSYMEQEQFPKE